MRKGTYHTEETRHRMSLARKGTHFSEEARHNMSLARRGRKNHNYGKHLSLEVKQKLSLAMTGRHHTEEWKRLNGLRHKGHIYYGSPASNYKIGQTINKLWQNIEYREHMKLVHTGHIHSEEQKRKASISVSAFFASPANKEALEKVHQAIAKRWGNPKAHEAMSRKMKKLWQDPEYVSKMMLAFRIRPTMPELQLQALLERNFPDFKYNGDCRLGIVLGGMVPDFVNMNGKKQVIELFGDYFHSPEVTSRWEASELGKVMAYNSHGYKCLVIWQSELKDKQTVIEKIRNWV